MKMDAVDAAMIALNVLMASILVGRASLDWFGVDFGATLFSPAGIGLTTAWVLGYVAVAGTLITNDNAQLSTLSDDIQNLETYYMVAAAGTLLLPVAFVVFPDTVGEFFKSADLWGLAYVILVTSGQTALGWML